MIKEEFILTKYDCDINNIVSYGNMFLLGNGHLGYRGSLSEYQKEQICGLNIAGFYDRYQDKWRESLNAPNPFFIKEKTYNCLNDKPLKHQISLNFLEEEFLRDSEFDKVIIQEKRTIHTKIDNLLLEEYHFYAKEDVDIDLTYGLDIEMYEINGPHYLDKKVLFINDERVKFSSLTNEKKKLFMDVIYHLKDKYDLSLTHDDSFFHLKGKLLAKQEIIIQVYAKIFEYQYDVNLDEEFIDQVNNKGFNELYEESLTEFKKKWNLADIIIKKDEQAQFCMRYSLYQLLILGNEKYKHSIPARGLSGQTYKGAIFWDAEIFIFPYFLMTNLKIAKNILLYRIKTLSGAKQKAKQYHYDGAFYAWESQDDGQEACSKYNVTDPLTHEPIRTYFNEKQVHISADIVYAIDQYVKRSHDLTILDEGGYEVIKQVAIFIMSYATYRDGKYHFDDVIGPDEYHERVNDNAFTNYMFKEALTIYLKYTKILSSKNSDLVDQQLTNKVKIFTEQIYLPLPDDKKIIEQFEGYYQKEDVDVNVVRSRLRNPQDYWGSKNGVATPTRVIKQADVIAMMSLLPTYFTLDQIKANYDFYNRYTEHGSSLSASMYSQCACKINYLDEAYQMFIKSASIDLGTNQKMFAGGIYIGGTHPASNGGSYICLINGFCGMKYEDDHYSFECHLPPQIEEIQFKYIEHGMVKKATINRQQVIISEGEVIYD